MKRFLFDCGTRDATASLGLLVLRLSAGLMMFIGHGLPKIRAFGVLKEKFYVPDFFPLSLMSSQVSLLATITAEAVAALLIVLGLATRPSAFVLGFTMVVAAFGVHQSAPWFIKPPDVLVAKELALMYLVPMLALIVAGSGLYSVDARVRTDTRRRRW
jgi:putative oxidoreductase